jgi:hypothetical protein
LKTYYELLEVDRAAPTDEIKRAFRREIARYHPDKVQHLGPEFQEIAATRASELTEAYRILMDEAGRKRYDEQLADGTLPPPVSRAAPAEAPPRPPAQPAAPREEAQPAQPKPDRRFQQERASTIEFVRKAAISRLRDAVAAVAENASAVNVPGIDAGFSIKAKGGLFKKPEPPVRLLAKYVAHVDAAAVEEAWPLAVNAGSSHEVVCLLVMGSGVAAAQELASTIAELRRKTRKGAPVLVPVDVRDWTALFPPDAPQAVRAIVQRLKEGKT